jgi:hypothetical protein
MGVRDRLADDDEMLEQPAKLDAVEPGRLVKPTDRIGQRLTLDEPHGVGLTCEVFDFSW